MEFAINIQGSHEMNNTLNPKFIKKATETLVAPQPRSPINGLLTQCEQILQEHRVENADLYAIIEAHRRRQPKQDKPSSATHLTEQQKEKPAEKTIKQSPYLQQQEKTQLKMKIRDSYRNIHERAMAQNALIIPRTQASNRKQPYASVEEETADRADKVAAQIQSWRSLLPTLIQRFSRIKDPRRAKSSKHKLTVVMLFGLFAFIFRLSSRREINRELTGAVIFENLQRCFPELDSIPHADTLARVLERVNIQEIEDTHIVLIKKLIKNKKFKKCLIENCLPISVDGTQKLCRDGELHDCRWLTRRVGRKDHQWQQQYVYVVEANIVLKNGLSIPLLSEFLRMDNNVLTNPEGKQDCETIAFERLAKKLKKYFPRLRIILFSDALYVTQHMLGIIHKNHWEYVIRFSKTKCKEFARLLNAHREGRQIIPNQPYYRKRKQEFYWCNDITWGYDWELKMNLVGCVERREEVDKATGDIIAKYSEHHWVSSIPITIHKVHELCNLGARKLYLLEDSINTEKHRGYHYEHAYSYHWNAMQGFHLLMRLAHAINALSEFTKKLKQWIKAHGCCAILTFIKETLFNPWLPKEWFEQQRRKSVCLQLQLE
jgi:hypothetical protein